MQPFQRVRNEHQTLRFLISHIAFLEKIFIIVAIFSNFEVKRDEINEKLRIKFCNDRRPVRAKLLKSLYPTAYVMYKCIGISRLS